ncbi:transporter substrate-binding domain-containing protein [Legionella nagasakiensis]|uniref:transporter substrate-binding domain-containing protein n=1 Tax=Legionella nagasakiensis TaxID=535290 RepID=UPI0010548340|nr:transporter substrate-binding domain-containing protein [Legionella nagasakiensis]
MKWIVTALLFLTQINTTFALKIGNIYFNPPFIMSQETGFDIDLMHDICDKMAETCEFYPMTYSALFNALQQEEIDLAIGGFTISPEQESKYIFSLPYKISKGQFLCLQSNPALQINDIQGGKIATLSGSIYVDFLKKTYGNRFDIIQYDSIMSMISDLSNQQIVAVFLDQPVAIYWDQHDGNAFKQLGASIMIGDGYGIIAIPKNQRLIERINEQLNQMEQDGDYVRLYSTYF